MHKTCMLCLCLVALGTAMVWAADAPAPKEATSTITIYYFHNTFRCPSCNSIESLTRAAALGGKGENTKHGSSIEVEPPYAELVKAKQLTVVSLNVDKDENKELFKTLKAKIKIPLIVEKKGDEVVSTVSLDKVWSLLPDNKKFVAYVQEQLAPVAQKVQGGK